MVHLSGRQRKPFTNGESVSDCCNWRNIRENKLVKTISKNNWKTENTGSNKKQLQNKAKSSKVFLGSLRVIQCYWFYLFIIYSKTQWRVYWRIISLLWLVCISLPGGSVVKNLPTNARRCQRHRFYSLSREDPLEKQMATHASFLACEVPWTQAPSGWHTVHEVQRVGHNLVTEHAFMNSFHGTTSSKNVFKIKKIV